MTSGSNVRLTASDGHTFDAYESHPDGAPASIVVVQEIFGVNDHIRSVVDRFAGFGLRHAHSHAMEQMAAAASLFLDGALATRDHIIELGLERNPYYRDAVFNLATLLGLPMTLKESINVAGLATTCGVPEWRGFVSQHDAPTWTRLRNAGAVLGSHGFSPREGQSPVTVSAFWVAGMGLFAFILRLGGFPLAPKFSGVVTIPRPK